MNELEYKLQSQKWDTGLRLGQVLIKYTALCFCVWMLVPAMEAFAGKTTLANFGVSLIADLKANTVFSHLVMGVLGLGGAGYGLRERAQKRKEIKRLGNRVVDLEKRLDPNRTSSGLTIDGRSRPEDEP
ncbi:MAG: hypothetical protein ABSG62_02335 [Terracidiphilus sp.]|jgi:hypothetical protein